MALCLAAPAEAAFGVKSLQVSARNADGSVDNRAGSHPYEYVVRFEVNTDAEGEPEGSLRNLIVDPPAGMTGNPLALPRCPAADFEGGKPRCPGNTQIGVARVKLAEVSEVATVPVYNLAPRPGVVAELGVSIANINSFQEASLRPSDYGVRISDITIPSDKKIVSVEETLWGVPMQASHDPERFCPVAGTLTVIEGCSSEAAPQAFLTLPTSCTGPLLSTIAIESVEEPGVLVSKSTLSTGEGGGPEGARQLRSPAVFPDGLLPAPDRRRRLPQRP